MSADHNSLPVAHRKFAEAYALSRNIVTSAMAAGFSRHIALSQGCMMLANARIGEAIAYHMRAKDPEEADQFLLDWGLGDDDDEAETLFDRIQAAREALALESRNGLPLPTELIFTRPNPSRRQRRAQPKKDA